MTDKLGTAVLLITHDLGLAAERAQKVVVMYKGRVVEAGPALQLPRSRANPLHPARGLRALAGVPAHRGGPHPRGGVRGPARGAPADGHADRTATGLRPGQGSDRSLQAARVLGPVRGRAAVDKVSFDIPRGTTTAVVGESGSGKSTVAKMMLGLEPITSGSIVFDGQGRGAAQGQGDVRLPAPGAADLPGPLRFPGPDVQHLPHDRGAAEGPRRGTSKERENKVRELMDQVSLPQSMLARYPNELSGGQRQRGDRPRPRAPARSSWSATRPSPHWTCWCRRRSSTCWPSCSTAGSHVPVHHARPRGGPPA